MSQVVYTELEGFPVCWPYLQARPFSRSQKLNSQNITGSAPTSESNIGLTEGSTDLADVAVYGSLEVQKFIRLTSAYKVTKVYLRVKKVGSPPDNLYVRIQQDGGWLLLGSAFSSSATTTQQIYGNRLYRVTFNARFSGSGLAFTLHLTMYGSPPRSSRN